MLKSELDKNRNLMLFRFVIITPVAQRGIDVKLPETGDSTETQGGAQGIVLTLEQDGTLKINQAPTTFDMLDSELRSIFQTRTDKTIFIRADETQSYKQVLRVIDVAKGAGIEVLGVIPERYTSN